MGKRSACSVSHSALETKEYPFKCDFEAYAGFHAVTLTFDCAPLFPSAMPRSHGNCAAGDLGSMESNVMAGRGRLGLFNLRDGGAWCAIFVMLDKHMQGNNRSAATRAQRRIAPKAVELVLLPQCVATAFCGRQKEAEYFNPHQDWPHSIAMNANSICLQKLAFLGATRSRRELLVFAEANPSRLPLAMGIAQAGVPMLCRCAAWPTIERPSWRTHWFDYCSVSSLEKTQCFATFLPFRASASSFFWSFLFWLFSLLTAFSSLHIVGSLTSKLPSIINYIYTICLVTL